MRRTALLWMVVCVAMMMTATSAWSYNVAEGKVVTASHTNASNPASLAVDGLFGNTQHWDSYNTSSQNYETLEVDFGGNHIINTINVRFFADDSTCWTPSGYYFWYLDTSGTWAKLTDVISPVNASANGTSTNILSFTPVTASKIWMAILKRDGYTPTEGVGVSEIEVYTSEDFVVKPKIEISDVAYSHYPDMYYQISQQFQTINGIYQDNGVHVVFLPYNFTRYSCTPYEELENNGWHTEDVIVNYNWYEELDSWGGYFGSDVNWDNVLTLPEDLPFHYTIGHNFQFMNEDLFSDWGTNGLAHELGHARGVADLYYPGDSSVEYPWPDIMKYPYGVDVFSENTVDALNYFAENGIHQVKDVRSRNMTSEATVVEDTNESFTFTGQRQYYRIHMDGDYSNLKIELTKTSGPLIANFDLYVKYQVTPTMEDFTARAVRLVANETINLDPLKGNYYIMVYCKRGTGTWNLKFTVTP